MAVSPLQEQEISPGVGVGGQEIGRSSSFTFQKDLEGCWSSGGIPSPEGGDDHIWKMPWRARDDPTCDREP